MARARNIKYGFFQNENLPEIEPMGRLLFIGLWCLADREGRLEDRPKRIKMQLFPAEDCDADRYLSDLARYDFITRYEVDGQRYIQINNFSKHQTLHKTEKESVIPPLPSRKEIKEPSIEKDFSLKNNDESEKITDNVGVLTVNPPLDNGANTVTPPLINGSTTVNAPLSNGGLTVVLPPDSLNPDLLIPDSPNPDCLNPESGILKEGSGNKKIFSRASASLNVSKTPVVEKESIQAVFEHWKCVMHHPNAHMDEKRKRFIKQALQAGYSVEQLCQAIEGCSKTPHNMGHNEQSQHYDGLHVILRDADQIDRFIRNCHAPPKIKTKADQLQQANINAAVEWVKGKLGEKGHVH